MTASDAEELLTGTVRINWGVYGNPHNPTVFRHPQEQPLLVGGSLDSNEEMIHLKIKQVPAEHLVHDRIVPYAGFLFTQLHVDRSVTDVSVVVQKFSRNRNRTLIRLANQASSWINRTFYGIGPKHLQAYLDQYCFSYNCSYLGISAFEKLLGVCSATRTITYPMLIQRQNNALRNKLEYARLLRTAV
ncbi:hypothetical protein ACFPPD_00460 [Cohnella suwonensis]|uniref:Transposase n=1 Tax=Cohnella suwonensis TaxID=696072 RepID=A0ABW0LMR5_9BACL